MSWPKICHDKSINSFLVENIEYMTSPCTFVEISQPRRLLTKKQNGLCCGYLSGFLVAQKTKRARGNSEVSAVPKTWILGLASHKREIKLNKAFLHILRQIFTIFQKYRKKTEKIIRICQKWRTAWFKLLQPHYLSDCM